MVNNTHIPKVFISYSWTNADRVLELAERLVANGIEVVLDIWEMKEGHDKYAFMEKCITDPSIDRVLIICDKAYVDKADTRTGGVGDETTIISSEVYSQAAQEKFIPVVFEVDDRGEPYLPAYIRTRIYIDLSSEAEKYETEFEKLLRNIFNKPLHKKPALGSKPEWIDDDTIDLSRIRDLIRQVSSYSGDNNRKANSLVRKAIDAFIAAVLSVQTIKSISNGESLLEWIDKSKSIRDLYCEFLEAMVCGELNMRDFVVPYMEKLYNSTHVNTVSSDYAYEEFDFFIWELLICTVAILIHFELYSELYGILSASYFVIDGTSSESSLTPKGYGHFSGPFRAIENICKPHCNDPKLYSLAAEILCKRERRPVLSRHAITGADIFLWQVQNYFLTISTQNENWFPISYIYHTGTQEYWIRLKSKTHCEKMYSMFGIKTMDELKKAIETCANKGIFRFPTSFTYAPPITAIIKISEIGTLN